MSRLERLPGTRPDSRRWNLIVGGIWFVLGGFLALFLLAGVLLTPVMLVVYAICGGLLAIGFDRFGLRERTGDTVLTWIPLLYHDGRRASLAAVVYALVIFFVALGAAAPPAPTSATGPNASNASQVAPGAGANATTASASMTTASSTPSSTTSTTTTATLTPTPMATPTRTLTSTSTSTPTSFPTATPSSTATPTSSPSATPSRWQPSRPLEASLINTRDADGDGAYEAFSIAVRADTSMDRTDPDGDPGDPQFAVRVNGEFVTTSGRVTRTDDGRFTIDVPQSELEQFGRGTLRVKVQLIDDDPGFDNQVIQARQFDVRYEPTTSTVTPTNTRTSTSTNTPSSSPQSTSTSTDASSTRGTEAEAGAGAGTDVTADGSSKTEWTVTVERVIDGDTMEVRFENGTTDTIRLLGVDTPETTLSETDPDEFEDIPDSTAGVDHLYEWGQDAESVAREELDDETVRIEIDPQADRRGSFGRLLVYLYDDTDDDDSFNRRLLNEGYARLYDSSFSKRSSFADVEEDAQSDEAGLWDFEEPATDTPTETVTNEPDSDSDDNDDDDNSDGGNDLPPPSGGSSDPYDCSDFDSQEQAQDYFDSESGDPSGLDSDDDGEACESLDNLG